MQYYLSSYKLGNETEKFQNMVSKTNRKCAYIASSMDWATDLDRLAKGNQADLQDLARLGIKAGIVDLREFFGQKERLEKELEKYDVIWVRGGNVFVLRQAMHLSGFDLILQKWHQDKIEKIYGGYSAGICVLTPTLRGLEMVDEPICIYPETQKIIWEGLGILDYSIAPHYDSDHPESPLIKKVVEYFIQQKVLFKALKDGEVLIIG
jgi:dipeptidase E